ncbi:MAG: hypothetical protein JSR96_01825 [Proteobacteria bacterium]|nr:hypothetical protein [Pseudomonadota bacterium]
MSPLRVGLLTGLVTLLCVGAAFGYFLRSGSIRLQGSAAALVDAAAPSPSPTVPSPSPQPAPSPSAQVHNAQIAQGAVDQRVTSLEQRLARLDLQAAASEGNAARAEGILIAVAARRAIERGAPLGYLADQLKLRFYAAQPAAVDTVIGAAASPVTLDQLAGQLDSLAPSLSSAPKDEGNWQRFRRELSGLFVVRHDDAPSPSPESRLDRARLMLRTGQVEAAANEVARLPGNAAAAQWIVNARRYAGAERALDLIETTALLDPDKLRTGAGQPVHQPSPAGPGAVATTAATQ